ncbi:hypothetical protein IG631_14902 [Alternaria alternata]|nr:hypothetical protein IG631_14902 [Alternaria alternata]
MVGSQGAWRGRSVAYVLLVSTSKRRISSGLQPTHVLLDNDLRSSSLHLVPGMETPPWQCTMRQDV